MQKNPEKSSQSDHKKEKSRFEQTIDEVIEATIEKQSDNPLTELCLRFEYYQTPQWAIDAIIEKEIFTHCVLDPCCGDGRMGQSLRKKGHLVTFIDIRDWGFNPIVMDFLEETDRYDGATVFMNPPFSKAEAFVEKAFELGARKAVCFQRFAWYESAERREFWDKFPPVRMYVCGNRADCWRHDIPVDEKGRRFDPKTGKRLNGTTTAHAWFVFESGYRGSTTLDRIYKPEKGST